MKVEQQKHPRFPHRHLGQKKLCTIRPALKRKYEMPVKMECYGRVTVSAESAEEAMRLWREGKGTLRVMEGASRNKIHWQSDGPFKLVNDHVETFREHKHYRIVDEGEEKQ